MNFFMSMLDYLTSFRYGERVLKNGEVPERSKGADCKSVGSAFEGSNPSLPITGLLLREGPVFSFWGYHGLLL